MKKFIYSLLLSVILICYSFCFHSNNEFLLYIKAACIIMIVILLMYQLSFILSYRVKKKLIIGSPRAVKVGEVINTKKTEVDNLDKPQIIKKIETFFENWNNPDNVTTDFKKMYPYQLNIYSVSYEFVFKWIVSQKDLQEVSDFTGIEIIDNRVCFSYDEWEIELEGELDS